MIIIIEIENEDEILYKVADASLIKRNDELLFATDDNIYHISCHPYEPCLYIKLDNKIIATIHNSFNTYEIEDVARENRKIRAITGKDYDIKTICELITCAINSKVCDTDLSYLEEKLSDEILDQTTKQQQLLNHTNNIKEITDDIFYKEYKKYDECVLDYCIVKIDSNNNAEKSHKEAVLFAMSKWAKALKDDYDIDITYDLEKMISKRIDAKNFFEISFEDKENNNGKSYMFLFLNPPHGCSYTIKDFSYINSILFPNGYDKLEVFEWSTDWSNYFDDGLEWWGARCISIYDNTMNRFIVIGASATD